MSVKILLADDSPTVHKVIKIILKDEPFEIIECSKDSELSHKLNQHKPSIVFLDFNFSETKTGYDICKSIQAQNPAAKILVMYGTFDTVDESALREVGVTQHVVKPFDTSKFIVQVRNLADGISSPVAAKKMPDPIEEGWSIRETVERKSPNIERMTNETVPSLDDDLNDWGMMVPGIIGKSAGSPDFPPVIDSKPEAVEAKPVQKAIEKPVEVKSSSSDYNLPSDDDLEYPDMSSGSSSLDWEMPKASVPEAKSKLVPLNELAPLEDDSPNSSVLLELSGMEDEGVKLIEDQIRDEVEEDLWTVDTFESESPKLSVVEETEEESPSFSAHSQEFAIVNDGHRAFDDDLFEPLDKQDKQPTYSSSLPSKKSSPESQSMPIDLQNLKPLIEQMVKEAVAEYCRQSVEKVAWEVIPDLAENLIKNELRKISDKVSRDL
ncbi:MAG: response regulator [Bacteriovoracaceae bacterium]|nr:response regulator [Bacteriovoracaceae bacterium]